MITIFNNDNNSNANEIAILIAIMIEMIIIIFICIVHFPSGNMSREPLNRCYDDMGAGFVTCTWYGC